MRVVNTFLCQGICWKFRFGGELRVFVTENYLSAAQPTGSRTLTRCLARFKVNIGDDVCVEVADTERRWFRWFRRNTARVVLEGFEAEP